jgi:hypothetical protein
MAPAALALYVIARHAAAHDCSASVPHIPRSPETKEIAGCSSAKAAIGRWEARTCTPLRCSGRRLKFVLSLAVVEKLGFEHDVVHGRPAA